MAKINYPPLNMHFAVHFHSKTLSNDVSFQSVQGLQARIIENEGKKQVKYDNLVLKRAYQPDSNLVAWCMDAINNNIKQATNLTVNLLNADHEIISGWQIEKALPVAWGVEELHAQDTKILIETVELEYQRFKVLNNKGEVIAPFKLSPIKLPFIPILKKPKL
ncbi:phage tail protein [Algibacter amylolyticus]|uniref:Phage tail protein n=1 Tax=Algibacter amylolyticus TaxID=1608400 RepID=A0A5M7AVP8_9FLAO|nr:phage tail protein [Algibacter amylolyticus]KAA5821412.1 phage tail protein [Algibacter amylolyticus]MBB5268284.1 phage tail-like protein [Algibacter amylolyticus]TSJ72924.1 phage tail protein [Algibacter amylolyticus]